MEENVFLVKWYGPFASPEDEKTKNALALVEKDAALYVKDAEAKQKLLIFLLMSLLTYKRLSWDCRLLVC